MGAMVIEDGRLVLTLLGLAIGAAIGAWIVHRQWRRRFDARLREATHAHHAHHIGLLEKYRTAHIKLQVEVEQLRAGAARQIAAAAAEPRAALIRVEARLQGAYAELDRLRTAPNPKPAVEPREESHGFAATQPMHAGM
ncbi:MAG TPA: hypothetical protein VKI18_10695 [Albitalea sp.]|nr:hypothetical protein [Albitalea sp.]